MLHDQPSSVRWFWEIFRVLESSVDDDPGLHGPTYLYPNKPSLLLQKTTFPIACQTRNAWEETGLYTQTFLHFGNARLSRCEGKCTHMHNFVAHSIDGPNKKRPCINTAV
jgi:hypothetical protein